MIYIQVLRKVDRLTHFADPLLCVCFNKKLFFWGPRMMRPSQELFFEYKVWIVTWTSFVTIVSSTSVTVVWSFSYLFLRAPSQCRFSFQPVMLWLVVIIPNFPLSLVDLWFFNSIFCFFLPLFFFVFGNRGGWGAKVHRIPLLNQIKSNQSESRYKNETTNMRGAVGHRTQ